MANITRYDPFNDLVDDFFKGFLVRPVAYEGRNAAPSSTSGVRGKRRGHPQGHDYPQAP